MTELLAPAGSREALVAAVQSGADAVYMGFGDFNARRNARNFSEEEFRAAVSYCHLRGVKVYLTLNTLVSDREMPALVETARIANDCGTDAVLVQDWGVLDTLRTVCPDLPLHASTQMSLHTLSGAEEAAALGMTRVVLARELTGGEIAEICARSPIEVEAFVHGALCMCYSGQCEMSAVIGRRSGNRGMCAQPCRLPYDGKAHPLSLRDMNLAAYVPELQEMGLACLKLEGRMKRPEYVAAVTGIYARLLREHRAATEEEQAQLAAAFSRSGFTDGYYLGRKGKAMFGVRPDDARWPEEWFAALRAAYEKENLRTVPVRFDVRIAADAPMTLTADDGTHSVRVTGAVPEAARQRALETDEVRARLGKTGGTAFTLTDCAVSLEEGLSVPASALNALRRDALAALAEARCAVPARRSGVYVPPAPCEEPAAPPELTVSLSSAAQLTEALAALSPALIYLPLEQLDGIDLAPYRGRTRFCAVLPRVWRTADEPALRAMLTRAVRSGVEAVTVGNLGHFALIRDYDLEYRGDYSLNVFNSAALRFLKQRGLDSATLSFELRAEQIRGLAKCLPCEAIVYGRLPLMLTENRVGGSGLTDRRGERFPVLTVYGGRGEIQNGKVLWLADRDDWRHIGLSAARLRFTTESPDECVEILRAYRGEGSYAPADLTRGLFYRGVE